MKSPLIYLAKIFLTVIIVTPVYHWFYVGVLINEPFDLSRLYTLGMIDDFTRWTLLLIPVYLVLGTVEYFMNKYSIPYKERNYTLSMIAVVGIGIIFYIWGRDPGAPSFWSVLLPFNYIIIGIIAIWMYKRK